MSIFTEVKEAVTTREAATAYGITVQNRGMCRCPFHQDRTPSMKVDRRFHCFGCGADGDVIDFTARLFNLRPKEAAEKLAQDFGVNCKESKPPSRRSRRRAENKKKFAEQVDEANRLFYIGITDYYLALKSWKEQYAPKASDEEWDERFAEAFRNLSKIEYVLNIWDKANIEEKAEIILEYGGLIRDYKTRNREDASDQNNTPQGGSQIHES